MRLEIYIAANECANCDEALLIAEQARRIAGLEVVVIDLDVLDAQREPIPAEIFAVPTYRLNGQVISLGNPEREAFLAMLQANIHQQVKEKTR